MLNNLLSNAIKHNYNGGYINCELTAEKLIICNSGPALTFEKNNIFNRFQKGDQLEGTRLGLAVAQEICKNKGLKISYNTAEFERCFIIDFY